MGFQYLACLSLSHLKHYHPRCGLFPSDTCPDSSFECSCFEYSVDVVFSPVRCWRDNERVDVIPQDGADFLNLPS